ncbi:hypothetical protein [Allorhodopirellula solitaria]|nr:hypothetical protein [Allorhodopirellula solitaria]
MLPFLFVIKIPSPLLDRAEHLIDAAPRSLMRGPRTAVARDDETHSLHLGVATAAPKHVQPTHASR